MRESHEVDCKHAHECFSSDGRWGLGAYDAPESSSAGGKPWCECWCMTAEENEEVAEAVNQAWIANKKFDHSTVQTCTSIAPSGVPAITALDDVLTRLGYSAEEALTKPVKPGQTLEMAHAELIKVD